MSSKTISLNPDFLKSSENNKTQKKKKKIKPTKQIKPNTLKKELLERIKNHKKKTDEKINDTVIEVDKDKESSKKVESSDTFNNDFKDSLNYLSSIKKEKKQARMNNKNKNKTLKNFNKPSVPPNIAIHTGLPPILNTVTDPTAASLTSEPVIILNPQPPIAQNISPPATPKSTSFESTSSSPKSEAESPSNLSIFKSSERKPPPFGVLKRGMNPTYRNWRKTMKKESNPVSEGIKIDDDEEIFKEQPLTYREKRLQEIKNKIVEKEKPKEKTPTLISKKRVKTIKKQYKLGKNNRTISVLIKNLQTRKKVQKEKESLSHVSIPEMKKYLKKRNLLKAGSNAPNDVIRETFMGANTAGDIENMNGESLIDNYLNK